LGVEEEWQEKRVFQTPIDARTDIGEGKEKRVNARPFYEEGRKEKSAYLKKYQGEQFIRDNKRRKKKPLDRTHGKLRKENSCVVAGARVCWEMGASCCLQEVSRGGGGGGGGGGAREGGEEGWTRKGKSIDQVLPWKKKQNPPIGILERDTDRKVRHAKEWTNFDEPQRKELDLRPT